MQLTVIGTGYLGFTHAVCMAELGHDVLAIDVDREKIAKAERAEVPFFEPGLEPPAAQEPRCGPAALYHPPGRGG
jgi:UDP-glucose 6-dehydrogenase